MKNKRRVTWFLMPENAEDEVKEFAHDGSPDSEVVEFTVLQQEDEFVSSGSGKLVKQKRKARTGVNPKTGAKIKIPAEMVVKFRVGLLNSTSRRLQRTGFWERKSSPFSRLAAA